MLERILIAGSGGQGIILLGKLLANVAVKDVPHVTFFPAYGAEVRGGTSNCQVILSSEDIASPLAEEFDSAIVMNQASMDRYRAQLESCGLVLVNSSLCEAVAARNLFPLPASQEAVEFGDVRAANFVMLGAYLARRRSLLHPEDVESGIRDLFKDKNPSMIEMNVRALRKGMALSA